MIHKKIAIIGCGNIGSSILNGLLENNSIKPSNIIATKRNIQALEHYKKQGINTTTNNEEAVKNSEIIFVALKPYNILGILNDLSDCFKKDKHILISLATGISLQQIKSVVKTPIPIFRAMPNTASDVGMSPTCIATTTNDKASIQIMKNCFNTIGNTIFIEEDLMNSATVLGACGIAYVLRFMRAMVQGGIQIGFNAKTASEIVNQTVKGAAELLTKNNKHPEYEIDKVTTPKGCTIAGLNEMEHNGFSSALIKGIVTSFEQIDK